MAVNALRLGRFELIDGQIRHLKPNMANRPSMIRELATAICAPPEKCEDVAVGPYLSSHLDGFDGSPSSDIDLFTHARAPLERAVGVGECRGFAVCSGSGSGGDFLFSIGGGGGVGGEGRRDSDGKRGSRVAGSDLSCRGGGSLRTST